MGQEREGLDRIFPRFPLRTTSGKQEPKKKPPWLWSANELCRPSDRRFLAK
jgi:hypothetical protein